jgi:glycosyltransferase involved in cell wall biosynthesis
VELVVLARLFSILFRCKAGRGSTVSAPVSVVVPVYNAAETLRDCLRSLSTQSVPRNAFEVIVVDDGSSDASAAIASAFDVRVVRQANAGAAAARNTGMRIASSEWVAFIDADCIASRSWVKTLMRAIAAAPPDVNCIAGKTFGLHSDTPAARFVDLIGSLDAGRHLAHPRYPFAPSGNVTYLRSALLAVGGYDPRYRTYEACDLHQRLASLGGRSLFEPAAVAFHRHRATWRQYWHQQRSYGRGLAQFMRARADEIGWSLTDEIGAWGEIALNGIRAIPPGRSDDDALARRGTFVKQLAQRVGFVPAYWGRV